MELMKQTYKKLKAKGGEFDMEKFKIAYKTNKIVDNIKTELKINKEKSSSK